MNRLVALVGLGGTDFVAALQRSWADGDAVLPVDGRLPQPAVEELFAVLRPAVVRSGRGDHARRDGVPVMPGDALVLATSGTTGHAKGAVLTHDAIVASARASNTALGTDPTRDHWLACLPLAHIGGLSVVTRALVTGTACTVHNGFDADMVDSAANSGATLVSLVPAALTRIRASSWRRILLGGSALPAQLPDNCVRTYGMTETGSGIVYDGLALPGVSLRADAAGQLLVRGPMLLRAYRSHDPAGSNPLDNNGWFATGDAGAVAQDGNVTVQGRMGDVIVSGGEKVWPDPVERVLSRVAGVREIAVCGRPDPEWGTRVVAYVVPTDAADPPLLEALRNAVKAELAPYCAPRELVVLSELPRTSIGKVIRRALR